MAEPGSSIRRRSPLWWIAPTRPRSTGCGRLSDGGSTDRFGWLKDRYGVSWQIVPTVLPKLLGDRNAAKAQRVIQAMLQMDKLDIAGLEAAHVGRVTL